ncbi:hypothetical protein [Amycolatopsis sp. CA-230715]|uniref:hypothetical protein n=1 Tax=Amycolatopsis sp. CA-230715 TaxID=2745196 RepID=UPI0020B3DCC8|nr:hypothetical protein [Amycolatopsis sp. CA-230715]
MSRRGVVQDDIAERAGADSGTVKQPPENKGGGGGGLERVTVNLAPRASRALEKATGLTGDSKTDTINRALQVYAYLEEVWSNGGQVLTRKNVDSNEVTVLQFF